MSEQIWFIPLTGERVSEEPEGAQLVETLPGEERAVEERLPDEEWLPAELGVECLKLEGQIEALNMKLTALKIQHDRKVNTLRSKRKTLEYFYWPRLKRVVLQATMGTKKKSEDFTYFRAGFRKQQTLVEVYDEEKAIAWAREHCPEAVAIKMVTKLDKRMLPKGEEIPGVVRRPREDKFFVDFPKEKK